MPRTTSKDDSARRAEPADTTPADTVSAAVAAHGTGQEPDGRGVHIPGAAPGQYTDHGPVTLPADAPRSSQ